jgi:two-component system, OmpR family, sensor histidine kinase MtrB
VGIGARITAIFGLGALLLSFSMGGLSYFTTRHFLLAERESAAQNQTFANALVVQSSIELGGTQGGTQYVDLLTTLDVGSGSSSLLVHRDRSYSSSLSLDEESIPAELRREVLSGTVATQTYVAGAQGQPQIVVGVPIPSVHASYFEVFSLADLGHTLQVIEITLIGTGVVTTLLGAALGRFASRRLLRPLAGVSRAAVAIAGGQLDTRLAPETSDPDLEGLTTSFNTMVDQIQARIEREARFNSDVSHELRSPLTTLAASLEVLEADTDNLPPRARRALQLLGDDLRRFQRMVGDLLEISRADAGSMDVFLEEVNAGELVQRAVEAGLRSIGDSAGVPDVVIAPAVGSLHVGVDKRRFERVMANLLENAANYGGGATVIRVGAVQAVEGATEGKVEGKGGGPAGTSGTKTEDRGGASTGAGGSEGVADMESVAPGGPPDTVEIAVEDSGPGIDPVERTKVFERFYRGSAAGRRGTGTGSGLGLALVAEHMRLMHGQAWVESSPTGGARVVITLPILNEEDELPW